MGDAVERTDAELVAAAAGGSETAFREIFRAYARPVYWIAHGLVGNTADAEDVMQETFLAAWRKIGSLDLVSESLLPWLVTICRFQSANRIRRQRRDRTHTAAALDEALPSTVDVEEQVITQALADRIVDELGTLSSLDQEVFRLCATEGYAYQAAAEQLGVSHAVVRNRLSRIRTRLRAVVEPEGT
ncbi:RNA polymerase sigma factor [Microbacterium dauci]|uniref:Sigma-70 family RNA polymerase sigma factor n=1 Tax=Microbacterium dauci TaxID=3048008 RepID=A0ABT6ZBR2_9MICO|nr:sigma-70 family RNA polymerase sigma factor [Microbacterium sp. LX3-4]MDJ1113602.1 sigma-70 family RNA polymerase sigma factor [Microbacterium sp. LX3-4]